MPYFYSTDRKRSLQVGQQVDLIRDYSPQLPSGQSFFPDSDLKVHLNELFPEGLSFHGFQYLLNSNYLPQPPYHEHFYYKSPIIDLVFELVRKTRFPDKPSRFQSMFAWDSLDRAKNFRLEYNLPDAPIFKIHADTVFCADMQLLRLGNLGVTASFMADKYWKGEATEKPNWEYLLKLPVQVVEQVA
jgi:hypothetical protein